MSPFLAHMVTWKFQANYRKRFYYFVIRLSVDGFMSLLYCKRCLAMFKITLVGAYVKCNATWNDYLSRNYRRLEVWSVRCMVLWFLKMWLMFFSKARLPLRPADCTGFWCRVYLLELCDCSATDKNSRWRQYHGNWTVACWGVRVARFLIFCWCLPCWHQVMTCFGFSLIVFPAFSWLPFIKTLRRK